MPRIQSASLSASVLPGNSLDTWIQRWLGICLIAGKEAEGRLLFGHQKLQLVPTILESEVSKKVAVR